VHQPTFDVNLGTAYTKVTSRIKSLVDIVPFKGMACNSSRRGDRGVIAEAMRTRVEMTVRSRASRIPIVLGRQRRTFVCLLESLGNVGVDGRSVDDPEYQRRDEDDVKGVDDIQSQQAAVEQPLSRHLDEIKVCLKPLPKVCN
jgi:hypothetical protein